MARVMQRLAFLFGAGATKGAGGVRPNPPLGRELYDSLCAEFPDSWGSQLKPEEHEAFRGEPPFEPGMDLLWQARDERPQRLIIDMALYFSDFGPPDDGSDHYSRLLSVLARRGLIDACVVATLNYECVLELSADRRGIPVMYPGTIDSRPGLPVLKPHGSCNFVVAGTENFVNVTMSGVGSYVGGDPDIRPIPPGEVRALYKQTGISIPPVISLYAPGKPSPVAERFVDATREAWASAVRQAQVVVVIGARPLQADMHIWEPLLRSNADVWYVGGQDGDEYQRFRDALGRRLSPLGQRFGEAFGRLAARLTILS